MDIDGKVILITGASSGIGAATARAAARAGARLVLTARRTERIEALGAELPDALAVTTTSPTPPDHQCGPGGPAATRAGRRPGEQRRAGLHVPLEQVDLQDFRAILELNVVAPLVALQAVVPTMRAQGGGSIVNVSSGTSRMVLPGVGAYAASKAALNMLSAVARRELAADGITVSTVYPFVTTTEFQETLRAGQVAPGAGGAAPQTAEDVAEAILALIRSGDEDAVLVPSDPT